MRIGHEVFEEEIWHHIERVEVLTKTIRKACGSGRST